MLIECVQLFDTLTGRKERHTVLRRIPQNTLIILAKQGTTLREINEEQFTHSIERTALFVVLQVRRSFNKKGSSEVEEPFF
ncbi:hypothetical protein SAMN04515695_4549 [Pseudovibrio sp. Tun.PSC04-5.I4]|nr:hypothetical protein SAMN04515695_4549 [Pseudovibrio sp. Tun.PSC04-5.I4]